jgi:hypothetical protein
VKVTGSLNQGVWVVKVFWGNFFKLAKSHSATKRCGFERSAVFKKTFNILFSGAGGLVWASNPSGMIDKGSTQHNFKVILLGSIFFKQKMN